MSKIFLSLAIVLICIALFQCVYIHTYGFDVDDFQPPSLRYVLEVFSSFGSDFSYDLAVSQLREFVELASGLISDFKSFVDGFNAPDTNLFEDIVYIFKIIFEFIFSWFELVVIALFKLFGFVFGILVDTAQIVLGVIALIQKLIFPIPKVVAL